MAFSYEKNQAIRNFCLECVGGSSSEVRLCVCKKCPLFPFRMGSLKRAEEIDGVNYSEIFEAQAQEKRRLSTKYKNDEIPSDDQ